MDHLAHSAELLDELDASVFSGDVFHSKEGIEVLEWYVYRWQRALVNIKEIVAECEANEDEDE